MGAGRELGVERLLLFSLAATVVRFGIGEPQKDDNCGASVHASVHLLIHTVPSVHLPLLFPLPF